MRKKLLIINSIMLFCIVLVYKVLEYKLKVNNLTFLNSVNTIFGVTFSVLLFSLLIQIIIFIYYLTNRNTLVTTSISLVIAGFVLVYLWFGAIAWAFTESEHIVEKDGKKMVAYVSSFMKTRVEYYDYINLFVRGNKIKIYEDYGDFTGDPFIENEKLKPVSIINYDDN
ncbi:hypothetical protein QJR26_16915 [Clostridium baratii]